MEAERRMTRTCTAFLMLAFALAPSAFAQTSNETGSTFAVNGARIYYHVMGSGSGVPLIVVNGGPGFDHNYLHISPAWNELARTRRVVFYDQRGNGRSTLDSGAPVDLAAQVDDLDALRATLKADRIDLLGHS